MPASCLVPHPLVLALGCQKIIAVLGEHPAIEHPSDNLCSSRLSPDTRYKMPIRLPNRTGRRGQAALFMTMTLTLSFALIGLVVDLGWAYWRQEACLEAAQSAAMAGVMYAMSNNSTWPPATCTSGSSV